MAKRVHIVDVVDIHGYSFDKLRELLGLGPCSPASLVELPSDRGAAPEDAPGHVLRMLREHGEPVKLLVPCNQLQWRGTRYAVARYGDGYCEMVGGFNCGYGGGGPYAVSKLIKDYLGLEAVSDDPGLHTADRDFIENENYRGAAILVELCSGKAYITVYELI